MCTRESDSLQIKVQGHFYQIPLDDMIYLEKALRKIIVHTKKGDISFYGKFCEVMPLLDERFVFCHRSYVLNMDEIRSLSSDAIALGNGDVIQYGKKTYLRLRKAYKGYMKE